MAAKNQPKQLARQLFRMSLVDGRLSDERVAGVLQYVEKTKPAQQLAVLKEYQRLVENETARNVAVVEHAGLITAQTLQSIATSMSRKYGRPITIQAVSDPSLLAGIRVRVGDDVYESSVAGQLQQLSTV